MAQKPAYIDIPAGTKAVPCPCGSAMWWVKSEGKRIPVACPRGIQTKTWGWLPLECTTPTGMAAGRGINHHIDCSKKASIGRAGGPGSGPVEDEPARPSAPVSAPNGTPATGRTTQTSTTIAAPQLPQRPNRDRSPEDVAAFVREAEAASERYGVMCTGAPGSPFLECHGRPVVVFAIAGKLFAAACSSCADPVQRAIQWEHKRDMTTRSVFDYYDKGEATARRFAQRVEMIRRWNAGGGFHVPRIPREPADA